MRHLDLLNGIPLDYRSRFILTCAPSPPPAPDYQGAAAQQGAQNIKAAQVQGKINNPNVINPYGTQTVEWGTGFDQEGYDKALANYNKQQQAYKQAYDRWRLGDEGYQRSIMDGADPIGGQGNFDFLGNIPVLGGLFGGGGRGPSEGPFEAFWPSGKAPKAPSRDAFILNPNQATITQRFSPEQQAIFDESNIAKLLLSQLASKGARTADSVIGEPLDFSGIPQTGSYDDTRQKVIDAYMSRANEDFNKRWDEERSGLIAAGLSPTTKAYGNSRQQLERGRNDAYQQAEIYGGNAASQAYGMDEARRRQAISEILAQRSTPLNEITALMSGSQVSNPFTVPGYGGGGQVQPAPTFAGFQQGANYNTDLYNAQAAAAGNQQSGLIGLGGTALMAGAMM
jgi:hypothetical protein